MSAARITDSPEQAAVIRERADSDVLVVAGAGSGKTYTMTRRIINLITTEHVPAECILGLTFTKKAAAELLTRVSAAVAQSRQEHSDSTGNQGAAAFMKPGVMTYDAFFQSIVRQYGLLVGFDQNTQPLSSAGIRQLISEVVGEHLDIARSQDFGGFNNVVNSTAALASAISSSMIGGECTDIQEAISRIREWDKAFEAQLNAVLKDETIPDTEVKTPKLKKRTKRQSDAEYEAVFEEYRAQWHAYCVYKCAQLLDVMRKRDVLLELVAAYDQEKKRRNLAEFSDFAIAAYQLVMRFPSIGARYRQQFTHVLLDEYQDTSGTQASLLATLFHHDFDAEGQGPAHSAVNAVGDPLQSIYAWRGASPGAFRMFQRDFSLDEQSVKSLSVTRRNSRLVLQSANILTKALRVEPKRASSSLMREVDVAQLHTLDEAPTGNVGVLGFASLGQEIDAVVRFAEHAIARFTPSDPNVRDQRPHAAVLFRSKTYMPKFADALQEAGLSTLVVGYSAVLERPEIRDVIALLHAASDRTDAASLMRLLATPRYGVGAQDLRALAKIVDNLNVERRFASLVQAGLVSEEESRADWPRIVREHSDSVPNMVFLSDVLGQQDCAKTIDKASISDHGRRSIFQASQALSKVRNSMHQGVSQVVRTAVEALNLDVDLVVAQALRNPDKPVVPAEARASLEALDTMVDTYQQELSQGQSPSLRGFMAWVDALDTIDDPTAATPDMPADVALMTVHQSKGLEWDAVAVVELEDKTFPSNQGDNLSVKVRDGQEGKQSSTLDNSSVIDEAYEGWIPPEYSETAKTWLSDPTAVPVPIRVDRDILPRFPHDVDPSQDPIQALSALDDVELIDDEIFGSMRGASDLGESMDAVDPNTWYLTQEEEAGRRLHADERRLAYVAITRARADVLLTYRGDGSMQCDYPGPIKKAPSNFWQEVHDALNCSAAVSEPSNLDPQSDLNKANIDLPDGFFIGDNAQELMDTVVGEAWNAPVDREAGTEGSLPWPYQLSEHVRERLQQAYQAVGSRSMEHLPALDENAIPQHPLLESALMVADDEDLMPRNIADGSARSKEIDAWVRKQAERVLAGRRQSVTAVQARAGHMSQHEASMYWRGIIRPIPHVSSPAAQEGTVFHAWAERFIGAFNGNSFDVDARDGSSESADMDGVFFTSRDAMLEDLERSDIAAGSSQADRHLIQWQRRLASSRWAKRVPVAVERQIVVSIPQLGDIIVNGKLDAVFRGGLDESDSSKSFTIVDWKTGVKPRSQEDIDHKLAQLDMYRLLLARIEQVPLDSIDATLYYLSESNEDARELHARAKTEQEILAELSSGIPEASDVD
ncbi:MAG: UvrD-helicase domain-containing protein [Bifidobacterium tsurumiense]|uniref:ATP-dependent DNA helicase n=1 Tax=Bifidobacterium tsurumiense TaxID=356829 RepID=UPI002A83B137|nr:UvrD-helicase domain-containing protein [Bifidobacterium tsurumiense]MDY4678705.1 UvrD-helicase domain-containing protein [Bifidobacterium tsurumiense]